MKRFYSLLLSVIFALSSVVMVNAEESEEIKKPVVEAHGAILMDFETGRVLWEKNAHEPLAMASTTKIMTAIVALENADLSETVIVSKRASQAPRVKMDLPEGEEISLNDLMYALMLQSSNDAAVAIAEHVGGSVEDFCKMMTDRAKELGAENTVFETPNGLDHGDHHSTAYDMALITKKAMSNDKFVEIINTPTYTGKGKIKTYDISNKNYMLNMYKGADGVKTGYTGKAGYCFVGSAKRDDLKLISVVLASGWGAHGREQKWTDTKIIFDYGFAAFHFEDIVEAGKKSEDIQVERSRIESMPTYISEGLSLPLTEKESESVKIIVDLPTSVKAPIEKDQKLGEADIYINDEVYKTVDILAATKADRHDLKTSLEKVLNTFFEMATTDEINIVLPEF